MEIINIDVHDGNGSIQIAVDGNKKERLLDYLRDLDELCIKKEYIEQDYAKVILNEEANAEITGSALLRSPR